MVRQLLQVRAYEDLLEDLLEAEEVQDLGLSPSHPGRAAHVLEHECRELAHLRLGELELDLDENSELLSCKLELVLAEEIAGKQHVRGNRCLSEEPIHKRHEADLALDPEHGNRPRRVLGCKDRDQESGPTVHRQNRKICIKRYYRNSQDTGYAQAMGSQLDRRALLDDG